MRRFTASVFACIAVFATLSRAQAALITLDINPVYGSTESTGATALIEIEFVENETNDLLVVRIENTTQLSILSKLTAVGFEWPTPLALPASFAPGGTSVYFDELDFNMNVAPGSLNATGGYDIMITSDNNFEGGNAQKAPSSGETQIVILSLGNTGLTATEFNTIFATWYAGQTGFAGIARFQAVDGDLSDKVVTRTPEPAALVLLGLSQLGLAGLRRGRAKV